MHAFDGNLARFGPASDCMARNRDTNDVSLEMGRELTPVLIAAREVWPDEHTWAKSGNSSAPAFERWRRSIHSCRRLATRSPELPFLDIVFNRDSNGRSVGVRFVRQIVGQ